MPKPASRLAQCRVQSAHLVACSTDEGAALIQVMDNRATVVVRFITSDSAGGSQQQNGSMTLMREAGGWRVDHIASENVQLF